MLFDADAIAFCDFQWAGKAPACMDVAYCLACATSCMSAKQEQELLAFYHKELAVLLRRTRCCDDSVPSFALICDLHTLAMCDLARWMAGWGWWGHVTLLR